MSILGAINSTITQNNVLNNYNRTRIYALIKSRPGIHYSEIVEKLNLGNGQAHWHISYLERFDMIKKVKSKQYLMFYPNDGVIVNNTTSVDESRLFKSKSRQQIFDSVCQKLGITQGEIGKLVPISQSTIAYHLIILEDEDFIYIERRGCKRYYYCTNES